MPSPRVISVNCSNGGIPKHPIRWGQVTGPGLLGDRHDHEKHDTPMQAVSLIDVEDLDDLRREGFDVFPGATGENLTVEGLSIDELEVGDQLHVEGGVRLELTRRRKPCYVLDAISPDLKKAIRDRCGFYARVTQPGVVQPGASIHLVPVAETRVTGAASTAVS